MEEFKNLLLLYTGIILVNIIISIILYIYQRVFIYKALLIIWITTGISVFVQGTFTATHLQLVIGMTSNFVNTIALSYLMVGLLKIKFPWKLFTLLMGFSYLPASYFHIKGYSFTYISFTTALATAAPLYYVSYQAIFKYWKKITISTKCLAVAYLCFALHYLDYPFLRVNLNYVSEAFTLGLLIIFSISLFSLASSIEHITSANLRNKFELERKIKSQSILLSKSNKKASLMSLMNHYNHDLRAPWGVLFMMSACLDDPQNPDSDLLESEKISVSKFKEELNIQYHRAETLISTMLKILKDQHEVEFSEIDINEVIESSFNIFKVPKMQLRRFYGNVPKIKGNVQDLQILFINLFKNAIEAIHANEKKILITVSTIFDEKKSVVQVKISDSGKGMTEDQLNSFWNNKGYSQKEGGIGIGVSTIMRVLEEHNADSEVTSTIGKGTIFTFSFPV